MTDLIRPDASVIFDVGGNCGIFSAFAARRCPDAQVYCFEPSADLIPVARKNAEGLNVTIVNHAVSDSEGTATLFVNRASQQTNSLNKAAVDIFAQNRPISEVRVECVTLDDFARRSGIERADVIKVDVQGFEGFVFRGAEAMLRTAELVFIESTWMDVTSISNVIELARHYSFKYISVINPVHYGADVLLSRTDPGSHDSVVISFDLESQDKAGEWF